MKKFVTTMVAVMAVLSPPATAASAHGFDELADLIQKTKDATGHHSGTAVAVIKDGEVIYEGYFGYSDIENKTPVDRDTVFYIASATKPFVALNTLLLEDRGKLDTGASLQQLFPEISFDGFDANAVTVRNLLTHTSGIDNQPLVWATALSGIHNADSLHRLVARSYPDEDTARGAFDYTNVGYNILSVWLDSRFDTPWQTQLDDNIFAPLGMTHTSAYMSEAKAKDWQLARPYSIVSVTPNEPLYLEKADETMQAAGGMVSTAPDLARFIMVQLADGKLDGKQVLPESVIDKSQLQQTATDGDGYLDFNRAGYAWGWYVGDYKGMRMLHHFGGFAGFHAHLSFIPELNAGLVVLNNDDFLAARLTSSIADYAYGALMGEADIDARMSARFDELMRNAGNLEARVEEHRAELRGRQWDLSRPFEAYVGTYSNPVLGDVEVELDAAGDLVVSWGRLSAVATAYEKPDHVRVEFVPNSGNVLAFVVKDDKVEAIDFDNMWFGRTE